MRKRHDLFSFNIICLFLREIQNQVGCVLTVLLLSVVVYCSGNFHKLLL